MRVNLHDFITTRFEDVLDAALGRTDVPVDLMSVPDRNDEEVAA